MATIADVAKLAAVAPITVSRVVNKSGYVREDTRQRVEQAIADLNYVPNTLGSSLRSKRTTTLALVLTDITNPFWTNVARGVEDTANKNRYHLIIGNTDASPQKQDEYLTYLPQKQIDGFLVVPVQNSSAGLEMLIRRRVPLVVLDRRLSYGADTVRGDSVDGAYRLTKHLLDLGHRHIAMISGSANTTTGYDRVVGYQRALEDAGLGNLQQVYWGEFNQQIGCELTRQALLATPRPTAIFAANNNICIGVMRALGEAEVRVPDDMSVVAFDDLPLSFTLEPFFTVMAQPAYEMGQKAAELLLARLAGTLTGDYQEVVLPTTLIVRRSATRVPGSA